jgi:hypothetical protein
MNIYQTECPRLSSSISSERFTFDTSSYLFEQTNIRQAQPMFSADSCSSAVRLSTLNASGSRKFEKSRAAMAMQRVRLQTLILIARLRISAYGTKKNLFLVHSAAVSSRASWKYEMRYQQAHLRALDCNGENS